MTITERILESVNRLPPEKQQEVLDFAEFLAQRRAAAVPPVEAGGTQESMDKIAGASGWPPGFFTEVVGGWQGDPLVREPQGDYEQRDEME